MGDPVVRAAHMKILRAHKARLDAALDKVVAERKEYEQAILNAYDAGLHRDSISEAAGISKTRAKQIKQQHRRTP